MTQSITVAAFVFGAVLLLIALLGGNFKIFGAEISGTAGRAGRLAAGVAGIVLIAIGLFEGFQPSPTLPPPPPIPHPAKPPKNAPKTPAYDPYQSFLSAAVSAASKDPLDDVRVQKAIRLALQGEDIGQAERLMHEAGFPTGFPLNLLMSRFRNAGGSETEADVLIGKLKAIGVRVEKSY